MEMTLKRHKGKHRLNKLDNTRDKDFFRWNNQGKDKCFEWESTSEDTWFRVEGKLVSGVGKKPRVAKTTKDTECGVVRRSAKEFLKRRRETKGMSGHMVYKIDSIDKGMRLKVRERET